jgi:DNA-binding response OmpR family regulator
MGNGDKQQLGVDSRATYQAMSDSHQLRGARILIVDDLHENLSFLRTTLEKRNFQVLVATSGEVTLEIVQIAPPDLILLDVMMPEMDGFETCRRLKQIKGAKDVPVIFVTAKGELLDLKEGFRSGGVDYLVKPIDSGELMVRVDTHLKNHLLTRQLAEVNGELEANIQKLARKNEQLAPR